MSAPHYGTPETAYAGPNGDGTLDGRILAAMHGASSRSPSCITTTRTATLAKGTYVGYTQLATLINQERLHNPTRTLLLSSGDNIQGDAMMYYFKTALLRVCL